MAVLTYNKIVTKGIAAVAGVAASVGGDQIAPNSLGAIKVTNGGGSAITVTVTDPQTTRYGLPDPAIVVNVAAGASAWIGPLPADLASGNPSLVSIAYSAVTSVTVEAISF